MFFKHRTIDMLHGPLGSSLVLFTLPIALSSMLQQLFNAADTAIVGYFDSADALAAVGTNTELVAMIVTVSAGLSVGANVLIGNRIGQGQRSDPETVKSALGLSLLIGLLGLVLGQGTARALLQWIRTPAAIFRQAEAYLRLYFLGYPFLLLYDFGSAILRARGDSSTPFLALLLSGVLNIGLNLVFVLLFHLGVMGVAIATDLSTLLSAWLVTVRLREDPTVPFRFPSLRFSGEILKVGLPSAVQGAVFCFANIFVQASVNSFGEAAIAGSTVAMNFEYLTYYIITAFGQTATTFTSQNHAAGQLDRCRKILWLCLGFSTLCSAIPIWTIILFRDLFSGLFSQDRAVIACAGVRIGCILLFEPICNLYEIPAGVLRGSGHALYPAACTMLGTCAFRILWICTVFQKYHTLPTLYHAFPLSWCLTTVLVGIGLWRLT